MFWMMSLALAGDPCPIGVEFLEYTPEWRDRTADLEALKSKATLYGVTYRSRGDEVYVQRLVPNTKAASVLQVGDVINTIQGRSIATKSDIDQHWPDSGAVAFGVTRNGKAMSVEVEPTRVDPLVLGMFKHADKAECRDPGFLDLSEEQAKAVTAGAFDDNRGFRCDDAHKRIKADFQPGSIVAIRGGRRVLLTMPGWATTCVMVADSDGDALDKAIPKALEKVTSAYVDDRHANP